MKPSLRQNIRTYPVWRFLLDLAVFVLGIGTGDYLLPRHRTAGIITLGVTVGLLLILLFVEWIAERHQPVRTYLKTQKLTFRNHSVPVWMFILWVFILIAAGVTGECLLPAHEVAGHILLSAVGVFLLLFLITLGILHLTHKRQDRAQSQSK